MTRKKVILVVIISFAILGAFVGWNQRPKPIQVRVVEVIVGTVQHTITNTRAGTLNACRRAKLSPSLGGQIANLPVTEGDIVSKGQLLFEIWNLNLKAQTDLSRSELKASKSLQKQACVKAEFAKHDAERLSQLQQQGLTSDESAERAVSQSISSQAACDAAIANISVAEARILVTTAALEQTRLTAPFDGTIAEVNGELGEYITPSPVGVLTLPAIDIIDNSCLYVRAPIDEVDAPDIRPGMSAQISLDAFRDEIFEGRVRRIAPYVQDLEKQARTVDIEVDFLAEKINLNMLPGYTADVEVILDSRSGVVKIPTEALFEGNHVYLYQPEFRTLKEMSIKLGLSNWQQTEVIEGLQPGQQIVTSINREGLADGVTVKIQIE